MTRTIARLAGLCTAIWLIVLPAAAMEIVEVTSPGGITAWLYEDHTVPVIGLNAGVRGGTSLDPEGREGAMAMMAALLDQGAADRDATAFSEARESLAANFGFSAAPDAVALSVRMLAETLEPTVALLRDALHRPRFDADAIERGRASLIAKLEQDAHDPATIASRAAGAAAFPGHPYGRHLTPSSVAALTVEDLRAAHRSGLARDRLLVSVAGAIGPEDLAPVLDALFADLPLADRPLPPVAVPATSGTFRVIELEAPQSAVVFGQPGLAASDPDLLTATVLNQIVGGGFGSRLNTELREKRGLTYGVSTYLDTADFGPSYAGSFASANDRVAEAIALVREEWARIAAEGVTEAELADAKRYLTGAYPLWFVGTGAIAGQLLGLQFAGYDRGYVNTRNAGVDAVTRADVARVARRLLRPADLGFVVVGRPVGLVAPRD